MEKKRKTFTSTAVKKRYNDKTYRNYSIRLRYDRDSELIEYLNKMQENEISPTEVLRNLFENK